MNKESKFISLNIGIMTISDTRSEENDQSGKLLYNAIIESKHHVFDKIIIPDDIDEIRRNILSWINTKNIDVIITTGGTGLTGRDKTPEAIEPLLEKKIDGFSSLFHQISSTKIGTSTIQSRALAGICKNVFIFCIPGSPNACNDAWHDILKYQLDINHKPCNLVEIMPRLSES